MLRVVDRSSFYLNVGNLQIGGVMVTFRKEDIPARGSRHWIIVGLLLVGSLGVAYLYALSRSRSAAQSDLPAIVEEPIPTITAIAALGRLEPQGEILQLSAPSSLDGTTTRVDQLLVNEGDWVDTGQVVAVLDIHDRRMAALERAEAAVRVAESELKRVQAGARTGDIDAQRALIIRLEAELRNAQQEYERFDSLFTAGAASASERDSKLLIAEAAQAQLEQAQSALDSIAEVRPVDVQVAQSELESAIAAVAQAEAELDVTYVRASVAGQVIDVLTRPGEVIGNEGIVNIGQTSQMSVVAEIYETDITRVQVGQPAIITSAAFPGKLTGQVSQIGLEVKQQEIFTVDPLANTDNKVVEVRIVLDPESSQQVAGLSNLQVQVVIDVNTSA